MSQQSFHQQTANGNDINFTITTFSSDEIKVYVDGVLKTAGADYNINPYNTSGQSTVDWIGTAPASPSVVRVVRQTDVMNTGNNAVEGKAVFTPGSSIKASDLNNNTKQALRAIKENQEQLIQSYDFEPQAVNTAAIKDLNVTRGKLEADIIDGTKLANDSVDSEHIVADSIDTEHYAPSSVDTTAIADNAITMAKLNSGALPSDITVNSSNIVDDSILNADINSSAAIAGTKITPAFGSQNLSTSGTAATGNLTVTGTISVSGTVDGRDIAADGTKLDGIEPNATANQTDEEIQDIVGGMLSGNTESGITVTYQDSDGTIDFSVASQTDNNFTNADQAKLNGIETGATADQTASDIKTLLQSDKLELSEMNTTSLDTRYFTETESDARYFRQDSTETISTGNTWSSSDAFVATTGAIDARIIELVDDVGGFVPIANETSFPTANPDINNPATGGTIVSVKAASTNLAPSNNTVTIANGRGSGLAVIITGVTATIPSGFGFLVETTSVDHTYAFHRLVPKATEVTTVATNAVNIAAAGANVTDINNFADLYQISTSAPTQRADTSSLQVGDLWFDSSSNKVLMIYDGSSGDGFSPATPNQSDLTNINIVAGQITFQEDLGLITNAVNTGSGNNSVNTVATNIANVNTAATNIAKITTVADDLNEGTSEIDTVATNIANVNTVGNAISNVNTVATANSNITTVAGSISNVNTAATNIASINTTASNIADVNNFTDRYQVASSNPSTDGGGNALAAGDLYFNTSANELKVYTGSAWQGGVTATGNFASITGNTFTGSNIHNDNVKSIYGTSSDGMEIFHNASHSIINDTGTGTLKLQTGGNTKLKLETTGVTVTGLMTATTIDGAAGDNLQLDFGSIA